MRFYLIRKTARIGRGRGLGGGELDAYNNNNTRVQSSVLSALIHPTFLRWRTCIVITKRVVKTKKKNFDFLLNFFPINFTVFARFPCDFLTVKF